MTLSDQLEEVGEIFRNLHLEDKVEIVEIRDGSDISDILYVGSIHGVSEKLDREVLERTVIGMEMKTSSPVRILVSG